MSMEELEHLTEELGKSPSRAEDLMLPAILEEAPDGIVIIDQERRFLKANRSIVGLFGYSRGELLDQKLELIVPEEKRAIHVEHIAMFFKHPKSRAMGVDMKIEGRHKDGRLIPLDISINVVEAKLLCAIAYIRERKG